MVDIFEYYKYVFNSPPPKTTNPLIIRVLLKSTLAFGSLTLLFENPPKIDVTFITIFQSFGTTIVVPPNTARISIELVPSASLDPFKMISEPPKTAVILPPRKLSEVTIFVPPPKIATSSITSLVICPSSSTSSVFFFD